MTAYCCRESINQVNLFKQFTDSAHHSSMSTNQSLLAQHFFSIEIGENCNHFTSVQLIFRNFCNHRVVFTRLVSQRQVPQSVSPVPLFQQQLVSLSVTPGGKIRKYVAKQINSFPRLCATLRGAAAGCVATNSFRRDHFRALWRCCPPAKMQHRIRTDYISSALPPLPFFMRSFHSNFPSLAHTHHPPLPLQRNFNLAQYLTC